MVDFKPPGFLSSITTFFVLFVIGIFVGQGEADFDGSSKQASAAAAVIVVFT